MEFAALLATAARETTSGTGSAAQGHPAVVVATVATVAAKDTPQVEAVALGRVRLERVWMPRLAEMVKGS